MSSAEKRRDSSPPVDPEEFLRAILKLSPEDAEAARRDAAAAERKQDDESE